MLLKNKLEIEEWLNKYNIKNYELIEDIEYGYVVNVNGFVDLYNKKLNKIDIKFNIINGDFNCSCNNITSLIGCPRVIYGEFNCSNNQLENLLFCPNVKYAIDVSNNNLKSLNGLKKSLSKVTINELDYYVIHKEFICSINNLEIDGLKDLKNNNIICDYIELIDNEKLGELQNITDIVELKKILNIYQEKTDLMKLVEVTDKSIKNNNVVIIKEQIVKKV